MAWKCSREKTERKPCAQERSIRKGYSEFSPYFLRRELRGRYALSMKRGVLSICISCKKRKWPSPS